ncbi:hypothetical protein V7x_07370 [Crateriforma conspicua]|uniref:Uncharacterized protein n=1 Tax=Crateriforma conspicua TaxID=2527996 RepID=A0A5C6FS85_9PLAN|nr:hypothetical protein V7x_07370 [Crateriforma conspicua]
MSGFESEELFYLAEGFVDAIDHDMDGCIHRDWGVYG